MAKTRTILEIFVASPGDVKDERTLLDDVISEFNKTWGSRHGVTLDLLKWETDSYPAFGADPQDVINTQIGDEYDIFIGIMWGRFGSRTKRAESGTEEEFNRAYSRLLDAPNGVQIMFYFKDAGIPPSKIDPEQLQKVKEFQKRISDECGGLYHSFETPEQFQQSVRMHLSNVVQNWLTDNGARNFLESTKTVRSVEETIDDSNPLANLLALEMESEEEGVIELIESANESMTEVTNVVERMSEITLALSDKFIQLTAEAHCADRGDIKAAKRVASKASDDLDVFVKRLSVEIVEFKNYNTRAMDTFGKIAMLAETELDKNPQDIVVVYTSLQGYTTALITSSESLSDFRNAIFKMPRMTTDFNRARKRAVAVMDDLLNQLRIASSQSYDVEKLLVHLLK